MKTLLELALVVFLFVVGAVAIAYGAGALVAIGGGIRDAVDQTDATKWYTDGRAQIKDYFPPPDDCPADPNLFCENQQGAEDAFTKHLEPVYEAGLKDGAPLWNGLMNNGLLRLVLPFVFAALATAMITKAVNKVFD
jgi:hypothetical protein